VVFADKASTRTAARKFDGQQWSLATGNRDNRKKNKAEADTDRVSFVRLQASMSQTVRAQARLCGLCGRLHGWHAHILALAPLAQTLTPRTHEQALSLTRVRTTRVRTHAPTHRRTHALMHSCPHACTHELIHFTNRHHHHNLHDDGDDRVRRGERAASSRATCPSKPRGTTWCWLSPRCGYGGSACYRQMCVCVCFSCLYLGVSVFGCE
jgi:hypothetical protein